MMTRRCACFIAAITLGSTFVLPRSSPADGLFYRVPEVGAWAEYDFELSESERGRVDERGKGTVRISSVGKTKVNAKPCRWIELEVVLNDGDRESRRTQRTIYKMLIPDEHLSRGGSPAEHIIKGWQVNNRGRSAAAPTRLREADGKPTVDIFAVFLTPPLTKPERLSDETIRILENDASCQGIKGTCVLPGHALNAAEGLKCTVELRWHGASPFGVGTYAADVTRPDGDVLHLRLTLRSVGNSAKSKLAEYQ